MQLTLIKNSDASMSEIYRAARVIYAETGATSLCVVEALASMIFNAACASRRTVSDIVTDASLFNAQRPDNPRHRRMSCDANNRAFQMCVRVATRMMHGNLPDSVHGAIRFHHDSELPDWAVSRGYIADVDGLLFYR